MLSNSKPAKSLKPPFSIWLLLLNRELLIEGGERRRRESGADYPRLRSFEETDVL
jgi:hypothetical protein